MKNIIKKTIVAVSIVAASLSVVQAAGYDWGPHVLAPAQETSSAVSGGAVAAGSFLDTYLFSLAAPVSQSSSAAVSINIFGFNITGGSYSLWQTTDYTVATAGNDTQIGSWGFDGTTGATVNTISTLNGGNYFFKVTGIAGQQGGSYMLNSSVAPVPEPEIYAMMGIGLGLLGWVGRRRKLQAA